MKFKTDPPRFWGAVVSSFMMFAICIVLYIYIVANAVYENTYEFLCSLIIPGSAVSLLINLFIIARIDVFSTIELSEQGITMRCYGKVWLKAEWSEFPYIGEVFSLQKNPRNYIYFSRCSVEEKDLVRPSNRKTKGNTIFFLITKKLMAELPQYVDETKIVPHDSIEKYFGRF